MSDNVAEANPTRVSGGFFAIDRGAFRCAAVGGLNAAIAHLVMARGTGRDNRTTQWSVHSIEQRTGISRPNAKKAVKDLLDRGIWQKIRDGQHPIYEAVPGDKISGGPFTADEQAAIAAVKEGNPVPYVSKAALESLKARGIIRECNGRRRGRSFELDTAAIAALTELLTIWLPNTLIDGAAGEVPPIELIRQTRSLPALRLLVELYAAQFLPNFGGVPRELLKVVFDRARVGEQGPFVVWGFQSKHTLADRDLFRPFLTGQFTKRDDGTHRDDGMAASFWPAIHTLTDLGLVERVGMLLDGDDEAEIIHPYAMLGGEPAEYELAHAAHCAALPMVTDGQRDWAEQNGYEWLIPVQRLIGNAALIEVYRLKYRPHTKATAAWYALMQQTTAQYLDHYRAMLKDR